MAQVGTIDCTNCGEKEGEILPAKFSSHVMSCPCQLSRLTDLTYFTTLAKTEVIPFFRFSFFLSFLFVVLEKAMKHEWKSFQKIPTFGQSGERGAKYGAAHGKSACCVALIIMIM